MEAEADLVNYGKKTSLEDQIERLSVDDEIESQLAALKRPIAQKEDDSA
jgi:phage shock protein A